MPTTTMQIIRDISGVPTYALPISASKNSGILATNDAGTVTAPIEGSKNYIAIFSYTGNVWVNFDGTAVAPTSTSETTQSELNPQARKVASGQSISLTTIDTNGAQYGIVFYSI